ncbi:GCN5 family acetyltransferase [Burkholderia territorii]|uniref:arsenic resistance N-acetyltransferase ArsN2 n=1 Tax=Burkholderia territorii TaxID=1503055 RepID=UPI0007597D8A|nr:arsenic resistance N-acetyltransferase ArsN2 [Burkholderia territorii]AOI67384.1 GCN5 family acetyltransferase [Burkholderia territorii]KUY85366.1 GCN5 family acetyltransferase [Burkholderia territorii]KUZ21781.1 GCN5 family acetyltransferase [Burkholderia territorii]
MQLRPAASSDLAAIDALLRASNLPVEGVAEYLQHFVVQADPQGLSGCGGLEYHGDFALLRSIAVAPAARGHGVGRAIVARLIATCRARQVHSIGLLTTTAEDYFAGFGFVRVARDDVPRPLLASSQFQRVCPDTATAMLLAC